MIQTPQHLMIPSTLPLFRLRLFNKVLVIIKWILHIYIYMYKNHCCVLSQACLHNFLCRQNAWQSQEAAERQLVECPAWTHVCLVSPKDGCVTARASPAGPLLQHCSVWAESPPPRTRDWEVGKGTGAAVTPLSPVLAAGKEPWNGNGCLHPLYISSLFPKQAPEVFFTRRVKWPHQWAGEEGWLDEKTSITMLLYMGSISLERSNKSPLLLLGVYLAGGCGGC